jgi:SH3-like domain-containing protein
MALNLTSEQMMDPSVHVPILKDPSPDAPLVGYASATVIASVSAPTDGYQHVLRLDGVPGWINTKYLKAWVNPGGNGQKCIPSALSNGRVGFDFQ